MSQSRKVIKDYSAIYLDGLRLDTSALGTLTLGGNEIGGSGVTGSSFSNLYVDNGVTAGSLTIGTIEGIAASISENGEISCNKITGLTGSSFGNLHVSDGITAGSLSVGSYEGVAASISDVGAITCTSLSSTYFIPPLQRGTQGTSIMTNIQVAGQFGSVLTVPASLATQGSTSFFVQNGLITPETRVIANIVNYNGTGLPSVYVSNATSGFFRVTLQNNSIIDPLNSTIEIGFIALGLGLG